MSFLLSLVLRQFCTRLSENDMTTHYCMILVHPSKIVVQCSKIVVQCVLRRTTVRKSQVFLTPTVADFLP